MFTRLVVLGVVRIDSMQPVTNALKNQAGDPNPRQLLHQKRSPKGAPEETPLSLVTKLKAILQSDPFVNGVVALAICVGFIHGWLKLTFRTPATTFVYDSLLCLALAVVFFQQKSRESFIPKGPIGDALKAFYILCGLLLFAPWDHPPFIISLAAIRGWCFSTLMFCLGYRLTKHLSQVRGYFYVLILIGLATAIYGLRQSPADIARRMDEDEEFARRYMGTYYVTTKGSQLRIFSTFVSSGAFGGTMSYVAIFAIVLLSDKRTGKLERLLLAAALLPICYAMVKSGARSALMSLIFGFAIIAWHRRDFFNWVLVPAAIVAAYQLAAYSTEGTANERYKTLLEFDALYYRIAFPTRIGWDYMTGTTDPVTGAIKLTPHMLGGGLGRSGYSVPMFLPSMVGFSDFHLSDGDLGRLMIDMGLLGMIFFGRVIFVALQETLTSLKELKDTPVSTVALACAACIVMAIASFPSGSPFLGIPTGTLVWFFLGTLMKLRDGQLTGQFDEPVPVQESTESPAPQKHFIHRKSAPRKRIP